MVDQHSASQKHIISEVNFLMHVLYCRQTINLRNVSMTIYYRVNHLIKTPNGPKEFCLYLMSCFSVCIVRQSAWYQTFALELLSNPNKLTQCIPGFYIIPNMEWFYRQDDRLIQTTIHYDHSLYIFQWYTLPVYSNYLIKFELSTHVHRADDIQCIDFVLLINWVFPKSHVIAI